ncbi:MAG: sensor histidine kinase [Dehalobacterium sp.]|jgi:signal transduction histidine kinase
MKRTLFRKIFFTYSITLVLSFGLLALLLSQLFNQYFIETKKELLLEQGQKISERIVQSLYTGRIDQERLRNDLEVLDQFLNARIWLVNENGLITGVSAAADEGFLGAGIEESHLRQLWAGQVLYEKGTFGGKFRQAALTVGYPIYFQRAFRGGILIHASLPEVQQTFADVYRITMGAIVLAMLLAYGVLYVQVRKISRPLREISAAAKIIAGGEFQKRLNIHTGDEIEELAHSFDHMAQSLEQIEDNRRNFIADISHDLRSPMTLVRGFIEGILDGTIPPEQHRRYLEIVLAETKGIVKLTNELLELNQIQQGSVQPDLQTFELHEVLRRKLLTFEQPIQEKQLQVTLVLFQESVPVMADPKFLDRILANLLDNAVKFTPQGEKIIIKTSEHKDRVHVEIINTGIAMDEKELEKIWTRFHKRDLSRGEDKRGYGLGLAIVREMITLLDERIWAESDARQVKITFTLKKS